ncbi:MAG: tocopherol cyclase family protein [Saprospiraceae bacterium]|nr:tocopherol cyclase family protein [Saprospiraceae bacterium]MDZ4705529.1 tocopherol cyclase family protein [Saprospiraceae bacterium]
MKNRIRQWHALWDPDRYHGWGRERQYFEGWYFKLVDPAEQYAFAIIPGIAMGPDGNNHAFIQVLDGKRCKASYYEFPVKDFRPSSQKFEVEIGNNLFSRERLRLDLPEISGELEIENPVAWPKMLGAPGVMGWYSFVPFMQCYHGVVSLHHYFRGKLEVYGMTTDFTGGKGYIEKDWGHSFPMCWIWTQCNHFDGILPVSLMASVAKIPWLGSSFVGFIVGFLYEDQLYRFATYTGAQMKTRLDGNAVYLSFKNKKQQRLEITALQAEGSDLRSPLSGNMTGKVNESMKAVLEVVLYDGDKLVYSGTGRNAGLELAGPVELLLSDSWRR